MRKPTDLAEALDLGFCALRGFSQVGGRCTREAHKTKLEWVQVLNSVWLYLWSRKAKSEFRMAGQRHAVPVKVSGRSGHSFCDIAFTLIAEGRQYLLDCAGIVAAPVPPQTLAAPPTKSSKGLSQAVASRKQPLPAAMFAAMIESADRPFAGLWPKIDRDFLWLGILKDTDRTDVNNAKNEFASTSREKSGRKPTRLVLAKYGKKHHPKKSWSEIAIDWTADHPGDPVSGDQVRCAVKYHFGSRARSKR